MVEVVAWDFDGVLNRNIDDGRFLWARDFERDTGRSLDGFVRATFSRDWREVMTGREDLRDRVGEWATEAGYAQGADALIDYMFTRDALPDPVTGAMLDALSAGGIRQVIATNTDDGLARSVEHFLSLV